MQVVATNPGIATANAPSIIGKSYKITANVTVPEGGGNGMIATVGGRWGGWGKRVLASPLLQEVADLRFSSIVGAVVKHVYLGLLCFNLAACDQIDSAWSKKHQVEVPQGMQEQDR